MRQRSTVYVYLKPTASLSCAGAIVQGCISPPVTFGLIILEHLTLQSLRMSFTPVCAGGRITVFSDFVITLWHTCHTYRQSSKAVDYEGAERPYLGLAFMCKHKELRCEWSVLAESVTQNRGFFLPRIHLQPQRPVTTETKPPGIYFGRQAFNKHRLGEIQCSGD